MNKINLKSSIWFSREKDKSAIGGNERANCLLKYSFPEHFVLQLVQKSFSQCDEIQIQIEMSLGIQEQIANSNIYLFLRMPNCSCC